MLRMIPNRKLFGRLLDLWYLINSEMRNYNSNKVFINLIEERGQIDGTWVFRSGPYVYIFFNGNIRIRCGRPLHKVILRRCVGSWTRGRYVVSVFVDGGGGSGSGVGAGRSEKIRLFVLLHEVRIDEVVAHFLRGLLGTVALGVVQQLMVLHLPASLLVLADVLQVSRLEGKKHLVLQLRHALHPWGTTPDAVVTPGQKIETLYSQVIQDLFVKKKNKKLQPLIRYDKTKKLNEK